LFWGENPWLQKACCAPFDDEALRALFYHAPSNPAPEHLANLVFQHGVDQISGAYRLGTFRRSISGDPYWGAKLADPSGRYIQNLLEAMAYQADDQLNAILASVEA
jgi:hypothetical protein